MTIILAGATGKLGGEIGAELATRGASVRALRRADFADDKTLAAACAGGRCVVSALSGLRGTIIDAQGKLLRAAVAAGVPRFIPSDFSIDYAKLPPGSNRNLDLRREFRAELDAAPIAATSILNGAFTDMLTGQAPFLLPKIDRVLCWGDPDQLMDWTTIADTAAFTAAAALDAQTPRFLRVAGDQVSARGLAAAAGAATGRKFKVLRPGGLGLFALMIGVAKKFDRGGAELYPAWQGMQYMHNMYGGAAKFQVIDNGRYPGVGWTTVEGYLKGRI